MKATEITAENLAKEVDIMLNIFNGDLFDYEEETDDNGDTVYLIRQENYTHAVLAATDSVTWYEDGTVHINGVRFKTGSFNHIKRAV